MSNNASLIYLFGLDKSLKIDDENLINETRQNILQKYEVIQHNGEKEYKWKIVKENLIKWNQVEMKNFLIVICFSSITYLYLTKFPYFFKSTQSLILYKPLCIFTFSIAPIFLAFNLTILNIKLRKIN